MPSGREKGLGGARCDVVGLQELCMNIEEREESTHIHIHIQTQHLLSCTKQAGCRVGATGFPHWPLALWSCLWELWASGGKWGGEGGTGGWPGGR